MRRGLGKGFGRGYKNLATYDPYIHNLSAKGVKTTKKTLLQRIGIGKPKRGRPTEYETRILTTIPLGTSERERKRIAREKKKRSLTKRQKKLGFANVAGAGAGFVVGGLTAGVGGMLVGVPVGTLAGFAVGEKVVDKEKGRPPKSRKYKSQFMTDLLQTREEQVKFRERAKDMKFSSKKKNGKKKEK